MNATQKYELIHPILKGAKTPKQVSEETGIPVSSIYRYLKRLREGGRDIKSLEDKSHAIHSHPKRLTPEGRNRIIQYKLQHPHLSSREIAKALAEEDILQIHYRTVGNRLREHGLTAPFFSTSHLS